MAPLSSSRVRDWPATGYRELAMLCVEELGATVGLIGSHAQRVAVNEMIRGLPADRYVNYCGRLSWAQAGALIKTAACVVANNSGIGHFAAELGATVVSVFATTHSPLEWMPRGPNVTVVVRKTACSPCIISQSISECPYGRRCLTDIAPSHVLGEIRRLMALPRGCS